LTPITSAPEPEVGGRGPKRLEFAGRQACGDQEDCIGSGSARLDHL